MERSTRQKGPIEAVLEKHKNPLTAPEIQRLAVREVPGLGIATVYRSLKALTKHGRVVAVEIPGQMPRYERANKSHHHHFLCRVCGGVFELEKCLARIKTMAPLRFRGEDTRSFSTASARLVCGRKSESVPKSPQPGSYSS